jgi:polyphenol oxidase
VIARSNFVDARAGGVSVPLPDDQNVTWLTQTHQAEVVVVRVPGEYCGWRADAAVTSVVGAQLLIRTADCAPVLLTGFAGGHTVCVGVAHAGWKGLLAGIIPATVGALRALGATTIHATLYPSIGPECYEFGERELNAAAIVLGDSVRSVAGASPAFDLREGVRASLRSCGVDELDLSKWACTACNPDRYFSFRARQDTQRLGLVAWLEPGEPRKPEELGDPN